MTEYVDSNAAGANNGTSWTDAWASLASASGAAAGEEVWIASDHNESGALTVDFPNATKAAPVKLLSVASVDDSLTPAASVQLSATGADDITLSGVSLYLNGIWIESADDVQLGDTSDGVLVLDNCTIKATDGMYIGRSAGASGYTEVVNCTIDRNHVGSFGIRALSRGSQVIYRNCTFTESGAATPAFIDIQIDGCDFAMEDCDLSAVVSDLVGTVAGKNGRVCFRRCEFPTSYTLFSGTWDHRSLRIDVESCRVGALAGTGTDPELMVTEFHRFEGSVKSLLTTYRTGGANDGEQANAYCWEMDTNANAKQTYVALESPPMAVWTASTDTSITVRISSADADLETEDVWIEVSSPNETAGANTTAQGTYYTTRADPLEALANLTVDSGSTWTAGGGSEYEITQSISPGAAGVSIVRVFVAKPDIIVYVDPLPEMA